MSPLISHYKSLLLSLVLVWLAACASEPPRVFDKPSRSVPLADQKLFIKAMQEQNKGRFDKAVGLWEDYLKLQPDSYAAYNNLGMIFYTEDRLTESINAFESALAKAPDNEIIRSNLSRSLQFQVTLLKENREYERAIRNLNRLESISKAEDRQKIRMMVEQMEDGIFEQVENANTTEDYKRFIAKYPNGLNADKARQKLAELEQNSFQSRPFEDMDAVSNEGGVLSEPKQPEESAPIMEESVPESRVMPEESQPVEENIEEAMASTDPIQETAVMEEEAVPPMEAPAEMAEAMPAEEPVAEESMAAEAPVAEPVPAEIVEESVPAPPQVAEVPEEVKPEPEVMEPAPEPKYEVVVVVRQGSALRVRSEPKLEGKILGRLQSQEKRPWVKENDGWYQIQFSPQVTGWISKKYSRKQKMAVSSSNAGQPLTSRVSSNEFVKNL